MKLKRTSSQRHCSSDGPVVSHQVWGWIPALDAGAASWGIQGDRISADLAASETLVSAAARLLSVQTNAQELLVDLRGKGSSSASIEAAELKADFASSVEQLSQAIAMRDSTWPALSVPGSPSANSDIERVEDQMMSAAEIGFSASDLVTSILRIADLARPVLIQFDGRADESEALSFDDVEALVPLVDSALIDATAALADLRTSLAQGGYVEGRLSAQVDLTGDLLTALAEVNAATSELLSLLEPVMSSQGGELSLFGENGRLTAMLDAAGERSDNLKEAAARLAKARKALTTPQNDLRSTSGIREIAGLLQTLEDGLSFIGEFAPVAGAILGADEPTRFLVLGQSADEVRATGGFVSSIWLVTFQDGDLQDVRYHDAVRVDDWERLVLYPPAPVGLEDHMNAQVWLLRDVSWEPDFPTTARTAKDMFKVGQRQDVDGVAALTQWTFLGIIGAIGEIASPAGGPPITSRNLLTKLEEGTDEFGRAYMDVALQGVLDRLKEPMSLSTLVRLSSAVREALEARELLLYFEDAALQTSISEQGWAGRVKDGPTDYLYVVDSNVGWSKADRNVMRDIKYKVDLTKEAGPRINLTLGYNNFSGPGSPGCEPQWLNRGTNYTELKNACYWNYFRVYLPFEARLRSSSRLELPEYSVAAEIGKGLPGEDTIRTYSSFDKKVLSGLFPLAAGERNDINLVYDLPIEILRRDEGSISYDLLVQKQPGIRQRDVSVEFSLPASYGLRSSSLEPTSISGSKVEFTFSSTRDVLLSVNFARSSDEPS